jgi:hypothetical protein
MTAGVDTVIIMDKNKVANGYPDRGRVMTSIGEASPNGKS